MGVNRFHHNDSWLVDKKPSLKNDGDFVKWGWDYISHI